MGTAAMATPAAAAPMTLCLRASRLKITARKHVAGKG